MPSIIKSGPGSQGWEYRGEHPGSGAGPGVVQQHVFKNITTHSLTNEVKSYNPDYWYNKIVNMHFEILIFLSTYKTTHHPRSVPYSQLCFSHH